MSEEQSSTDNKVYPQTSNGKQTTNAYNDKIDLSGGEPEYGFLGACLLYCSIILSVLLFPFGACLCVVKIVAEYERAVVFRLGRLQAGGAKGPGLFCIVPCTDEYKQVDLRTVSFDVPPQEVRKLTFITNTFLHKIISNTLY